jgi:hypothetical protein
MLSNDITETVEVTFRVINNEIVNTSEYKKRPEALQFLSLYLDKKKLFR